MNNGKDIWKPLEKNISKSSLSKFEWKIKENAIPNESQKKKIQNVLGKLSFQINSFLNNQKLNMNYGLMKGP